MILGNKFIKNKEELENFGEIVMGSSYLSSVLPGTFEIIKEKAKEEFLEKGLKQGELIGLDKGVELGRKQGHEEGIISVAKRMLEKNMPIDEISETTGLSIEMINSLKEK